MNDATRALVNIAVLEAVLLGIAAAVYLYTNAMTYLIGGIIGAQLVCAPMFVHWARAQANARRIDAEKER